MLVFTGIAFSPWSEKARWALDHHRIEYREVTFTPVFGEPKLRLSMRRPFGRITVPVLRDGRRWFTDSLDIARYAEQIGSGMSLFPTGKLAEIGEWNRRSEVALAAGRTILMRSWASTSELAVAALPPNIPAALKGLFLSLGRQRLRSFMKKYRLPEGEDSADDMLTTELDVLENALSSRRYLVGDSLTYADIAMALTLQQVSPVDPRYIVRLEGLGPEGMNVDELEYRYVDLIAWRDELYAQHRFH